MTPTQCTILTVLQAWFRQRPYSPTARELCKIMGWASAVSAANNLKALERLGYVSRLPIHGRPYQLTDQGRVNVRELFERSCLEAEQQTEAALAAPGFENHSGS